jgi:hypothetical protein
MKYCKRWNCPSPHRKGLVDVWLLLVLNLSTKMVVSGHLYALGALPQWKKTSTPRIGGWVGPEMVWMFWGRDKSVSFTIVKYFGASVIVCDIPLWILLMGTFMLYSWQYVVFVVYKMSSVANPVVWRSITGKWFLMCQRIVLRLFWRVWLITLQSESIAVLWNIRHHLYSNSITSHKNHHCCDNLRDDWCMISSIVVLWKRTWLRQECFQIVQ